MNALNTGIAMNRIAALLLVVAIAPLWGCDKTEDSDTSKTAEAVGWSAQVAFTESTGTSGIEVKRPGSEAFITYVGGEAIPPGSTIRTAPNTRLRLALEGAELVVNHSTTVTLVDDSARTLDVANGQVVLETTDETEDKAPATVILPTGKVVLHGTKVSAVAGEQFSTVSVASGTVEVSDSSVAIEGRAGDEIVLPRTGAPTVHSSPGLGEQFGWSELADPEQKTIEVPRGLGKLVGKAPGGERERALELVEHTVDAKIQGNIAYTEITERFRNPTSEVLEGVYRFPLPADAQISRLALDVNGKLMEGQFLETKRAEWIWRDIINQSRDPAMLKWKQGNQFELRIFPIEAKSVRRVIIGYTQRLDPSAGGYRYIYPMPVDHAGTIPAKKFNFEATVAGHDPTQVFQVSGYDAAVAHKGTADDKALTKVTWSQDNFIAAGDLAIRYSTPYDENGFEAYRYDSKREDRGFFSVSIRPRFDRAEEVAARDLLMVVDRSYHRQGQALELQKRVINAVLDEVDPLDRVAVIACNSECIPVGPADFGRATPDRVSATQSALETVTATGVSNPVEVARVAAAVFGDRAESERAARLVWFADGIASSGELRPGKLRDALSRVAAAQPMRTTLVEVGGDVDDANKAAIAAGLGAVEVTLDPAMTTTGHALSVLGTTYGDLLTNVSVELPDGAEAVYPRGYRAVAPGDEIVVMGRVKGDLSGEVKVTGNLRGEPWSATYPVSLKHGPTSNAFLPRMWAAERIRDLELSEEVPQDTIVDLSKRHGVLSRFTTLLALESEEMMREYGVRNRTYEKWDGSEGPTTGDVGQVASAEAEMAEDSGDFDGEAAAAPAPAPSSRSTSAPRKQAAKPKSAPMMDKKKMDMSDDIFGSSRGGGGGMALPRRRYRMPRRQRVASIRLESASDMATDWERKNVQRKMDQLAREPGNRTRTMRLIRAMHRANMMNDAKSRIDSWIGINHMDPEALVQLAQWHSLRGEMDDALVQLANGVDAAPRGEWVQERAHRAFLALGDDARACSHGVALRALQKRPEYDQDDALQCPMATDTAAFGAEPEAKADELSAAERKAQIEAEMQGLGVKPTPAAKPASLRGNLVVEASWAGAHDLDIIVVEPDGRALSYLSQRRKVSVANVRATGAEAFALPTARVNGTYRVMLVRQNADANVAGNVKVTFRGKTKVFPFSMAAGERSTRIADAERTWSWGSGRR